MLGPNAEMSMLLALRYGAFIVGCYFAGRIAALLFR